jgi:hypothetical protein
MKYKRTFFGGKFHYGLVKMLGLTKLKNVKISWMN